MNERFLPLLCALALLLTGCAGTAGDTSAEPSGETSTPVQEEPDSSAPAEAVETDMAYMWITDLTEDAEFDQYIQQESTMKLMQELNALFQELGVNYSVYDDYEFVFAPFQFYVAEQTQGEIQAVSCHMAEKLRFIL